MRVVADGQVAGDEKDLFPVLVYERLSREYAGRKAQEARARAALVCLIERAGQNLLLDTFRIASRSFPPGVHVEGMEFMVLLVDAHRASPSVQEIDNISR